MISTQAANRLVSVPTMVAPPPLGCVIGGHIDAAFASVPSVISSVQANAVRALAVSSAKRIAVAPDIPTIAESGYDKFDVNPWWGVLGPAGLSAALAQKINADIAEILQSP